MARISQSDVSQKEFYLCKFPGVKGEGKLWKAFEVTKINFWNHRGIYRCKNFVYLKSRNDNNVLLARSLSCIRGIRL